MELARLQIVIDAAKSKADVTDLRVTVEKVGDAGEAAGQKAGRGISQVGDSAKKAGGEVRRASGEIQNGLGGALRGVGGLVAGAFSVVAITRFLQEAVKVNIEFHRMENVLTGVTGSAESAREQLGFLQSETQRLGINFRETVQAFIRFEAATKGSGLSTQQLKDIFSQTSEAARKLGLSTFEQQRIFLAYEQMISKGVVSMEELRRQLGNALPGAFSTMARAMKVSTRELMDMVESGNLLASDALPKFAKQLSVDVKGSVDTLSAAIANLTNAWDRFKNSIGENLRPVLEPAIEGLGAVISKEAAGFDALAAYRAIGGGKSTAEQQIQELRRRFPNAAAPAVPIGPMPGVVPAGTYSGMSGAMPSMVEGARPGINFLKEFVRMAAEEPGFAEQKRAQFDRSQFAVGGAFGLPKGFEPVNPESAGEDPEKRRRFEDQLRKLTLDRLDGMQRIVATYDIETDKVRQLGLSLGKEAQLVGLINEARQKAVADETLKKEAESAKEMTDAYKRAADISQRLFVDSLGDESAQKVERLSEQFREATNELVALSEEGADVSDMFRELKLRFDAATAAVRETRNRGAFSGRNFGQLSAERDALEKGLLTETDARKFEQTAQKIQDISAEMARQMKAGNVSVSDAFQEGLKEQARAYGSFKQRIAETASGLVQALDSGFTDAFTSMITGTKSVSQAFSDMGKSIIADLVKIAVQQLVVRQVLNGLSSSFGSFGGTAGSGSAGGALADAAATGHFGGVVGWLPARRMHGGGVSGDEVVVNSRRGEVMFTPEQVSVLGRAIAGASGDRQRPIQIYTPVDDAAMTQHLLNSPDVIVSVIGKRRTAIKQLLG